MSFHQNAFPCALLPLIPAHHPILTPSSSFYSLAQADSVTQQKAGAAVSHKCRLSSHFQLGLETTVINYCYSSCCLCSKTCFFTPKRVTRSLRDATWPSLYHQGLCVSQYIKGTLAAFCLIFALLIRLTSQKPNPVLQKKKEIIFSRLG